ncbi:magnesium transporter MRS2-4 isoform X3 [Cryptomeria japonica]|uniref:magnesium transporter MRS2-4 isoform X3 n=1 Tax=Cryptomeria japonica TaxID=3369 RepID=UPI0027DA184B|nr:magnesium transporter MRS2-4 isoform X3 [Cryptomeria japonica]
MQISMIFLESASINVITEMKNGKSGLRRISDASVVRSSEAEAELQLQPRVHKTKNKPGTRLWMRFDAGGNSEVLECDKHMIMKRVSIPARDLRILGPVFSHSANILAREKAMVVNLEFIKAIVTAEEIFLLDPLNQAVLQFVDQLRQQLPCKISSKIQGSNSTGQKEKSGTCASTSPGPWLPVPEALDGLQYELPFEFRVLEIALEVVCTYMDTNVAELEREAYPVLDELVRNVSTKNLEHVRSLKSNLTHLLARAQKNQQLEASVTAGGPSGLAITPKLSRSLSAPSFIDSVSGDEDEVEDLEMLLEAYFMQLDGTGNKILSVREYIDDTEDYVNIQLDNHRNELIQFQLTLAIASFVIVLPTVLAGILGMNIHCPLYDVQGIFFTFWGSILSGFVALFFIIVGYARRKLGT